MRIVRVSAEDGLRLAARCWGNPRDPRLPLLCLPGLSRTGADFAGLAEALAPRRVVALDLIGRGLADRSANAARYAPPALLNDIRHASAALGLHRVIAAGASFGGLLAMALAVAQPTLPAGAILNDIGPDAASAAGASAGAAIWLDVVGDPPAPCNWAEAIAYCQSVMPDLSITTPAGWRELAEATFEPAPDGAGLRPQWDPAIVAPLRQPGEVPDVRAFFRALTRWPTLAVRGGKSDVLTAEGLAAMHSDAPSLRSVTLPGIGHAPTLTEPAALAAIRDLLAEIDAARA